MSRRVKRTNFAWQRQRQAPRQGDRAVSTRSRVSHRASPRQRHDKHRGKAIEQFDQIAREATELPRGSDNDKHRGKAIEQFEQSRVSERASAWQRQTTSIAARRSSSSSKSRVQANELPRGSDNDKHRGKAIEQFDQIARQANELPRGSDNDKHRGKAIEQIDQIA
jgi:hypothetical protein